MTMRWSRLWAPLLAVLACGCGGTWLKTRQAFHFAGLYLQGPAPKSQCGDAGRYRWCAYAPPRGPVDPSAVVYFFHYGSGDEKTFGGPVGRAFYARYAERGLPAPRAISVSFAPYWIVVERSDGKYEAPTVAEFVTRWMPEVEKGAPPARRFLWGMSQGGFTAAVLALRRPDLWAAGALSCPALPSVPPFSEKKVVADYAGPRGLDADKIAYGLSLFGFRLKGADSYAPIDPLKLAENASASSVPLYIEPNEKDEYGFFDGAKALSDGLAARGAPHEFVPHPGGHCENSVTAVADFFAAAEGGGTGARPSRR